MKKSLLFLVFIMMAALTYAQDFRFDEVSYTPQQTVFRLFAPADAKSVKVRIYRDGLGGKALKTVNCKLSDSQIEQSSMVNGQSSMVNGQSSMVNGQSSMVNGQSSMVNGGIWTAVVKGDLMGRFYTFDMGRGECPGVFAKAVGVNGKRGAIVKLSDTDPQGWDQDRHPVCKSPADLVVYELHHRDFSIARPDAENTGKFLALTEPWAIDHLKSLGVNAIHILPSYDYGSVDETRIDPDLYYEYAYESLPKGVIPARPDFSPQYNWGYDPVNYNVPEGSYSTDPYSPEVRIREFKQMVKALHDAGIRVILDVVYNHTYDIEHSNFQRTYPDYYYRKVATVPDGSPSGYSNGSGCGNETASEQPMMRRFMLESVKYWIDEYHIDGFRFDLMGCHDIETMNQIRQMVDSIDPTIFIYGEGWSAGPCALPNDQLGMKANILKMPGIAAFSDEIRDALRGPFDDDTKPGWLGGAPDCKESLKFGIAGAIRHPQVKMKQVNYSQKAWALEPTQMMSYVSCHDDMCLVDRLKASVPGLDKPLTSDLSPLTSELVRLDLLAQTAVFTSQGVPFMLSGEELLRTKQGVHNSFESPDSINQLDWSNKAKYPQVFDYYKNLIALRKHHPAFRLGSADLVRKHLEFLDSPAEVVAFRLKNYAGRDDWRNIIVILNASRKAQSVAIPAGTYTEVCCDGVINEEGLGTITGDKAVVSAQSALILHD